MRKDLESIIRNENKNRVKWGFVIGLICSVVWGAGYVALDLMWRVTPFAEWAVFPEGPAGFIIATLCIGSALAFSALIILTVFWLGGTGKIADLPRTVLNFKLSKWYLICASFGGPVAIYGSVLAVGYVGAAFAASIALLCSVVATITAKIWYGENISQKTWLGLAFILVGGIFIVNPIQMLAEIANPASPDGVWLGYLGGMMAAVGFGLEAAVAGRILDVTDADSGLLTRITAEVLLWFVIIVPFFMIIFGPGVIVTAMHAAFTSIPFMVFVVLGTLTLNLAYIFMYKSYPLIGVGRGVSISTLYAAWSIFFLVIFLGIPIGWWILTGAAMAIVGTFVMYWESGDSLLECTRDCNVALDEVKGGK
ncbi:DMT family transporter [Methanococcoides sp. LMO-2]|uniref:DMT family transporter n=1 Tax=Methanococcoides cohabitans TaxID=3136559 RepID=A0ABU9KSA8_9EURY